MGKSLPHLIHRAGQFADDRFTAYVQKHPRSKEVKLTMRQYLVLFYVEKDEGLSQTGLCERTGVDRSTLADIVRRLISESLLHRRRTKEDARRYAVRLTDLGREVLAEGKLINKAVEADVLKLLSSDERSCFKEALLKIDAGFQPKGRNE